MVEKYAAMERYMKTCVSNAEAVKDRLLQIVLNHTKPISEERRVEIMKMDLMALKAFFMDTIRNPKIYHQFKKYNSTVKLKTFSRGFNTFILDRNKYTHGQLCLLKPGFTFVIEYIETPSHITRYAQVDIDTIKSYNDFYNEIVSVISEYSIIQQEKIIGDYKKKNNIN